MLCCGEEREGCLEVNCLLLCTINFVLLIIVHIILCTLYVLIQYCCSVQLKYPVYSTYYYYNIQYFGVSSTLHASILYLINILLELTLVLSGVQCARTGCICSTVL